MDYILEIPVKVAGEIMGRNQKIKIIWFYDTVPVIIKSGETPEHTASFVGKNIINGIHDNETFNFYQNENGDIFQKATKNIMDFLKKRDNIEDCMENLQILLNEKTIENIFKNVIGLSYKDYIDLNTSKSQNIISTNKQYLQNKIQQYFDDNYVKHKNNDVFYKKNEYYFYVKMTQEINRSKEMYIHFTKENSNFKQEDDSLGSIPVSPVSLGTLLELKKEFGDLNSIAIEGSRELISFDISILKRVPLSEKNIVEQSIKNILHFYKPFDFRDLSLDGAEAFFNLKKSINIAENDPVFENMDFTLLRYHNFIETFLNKEMIKRSMENYNAIKTLYNGYLKENQKTNPISWSCNKMINQDIVKENQDRKNIAQFKM